MQRVKEEFFISMIFVLKWLLLGIFGLALIYFAISTAYNKTYFEPKMAAYDLEISELIGEKDDKLAEKAQFESGVNNLSESIVSVKGKEIADAKLRIEEAKSELKKLNIKWWNKVPLPLSNKNQALDELEKELEIAEQDLDDLEAKLEDMIEQRAEYLEEISDSEERIGKLEEKIADKRRDKERAKVGVTGPLIWVAGLLGLT